MQCEARRQESKGIQEAKLSEELRKEVRLLKSQQEASPISNPNPNPNPNPGHNGPTVWV